jgi:hypothetical protein
LTPKARLLFIPEKACKPCLVSTGGSS